MKKTTLCEHPRLRSGCQVRFSILVLASVLCVSTGSAMAAVTNGGFEAGLSGWTSSAPWPDRVMVVTNYTDNYGRTWAAEEGASFAVLETRGGGGSVGGLLWQAFPAAAGDILSLDYKYYLDSFYSQDLSGKLYNSSGGEVATLFYARIDGYYDGASEPSEYADWQAVGYTFTQDDTYTLKFVVGPREFSHSALGVDNVVLTTVSVPAPGALLLGGMGMSLVSLLRRRRAI